MGYTHTLNAIYKVKSYLDILKAEDGNEVRWAADEPRKLLYKIHRALASAEVLGEVNYRSLRQEWEVGATKTEIVARKRKENSGLLILDANDSLEIVEQLLTHKNSEQALKFPMIPDVDSLRIWAGGEPVHIEFKKDHIIARWL